MSDTYNNLQHAWLELANEEPEAGFVKIPALEAAQFLSFRRNAFYKRALRMGAALSGQLKLREGEKVAILTDSPHDILLVLHGCWLARMVAVPLDSSLNDDALIMALVNCDVKAVVFPLALVARMAGLFSRAPKVTHWVVSGTSSGSRPVPGVKRLEEIMAQAFGAGLEPDSVPETDCPALIVTSASGANDHAIAFSQSDIVHAALTSYQTLLAGADPQADLIWSLLPRKSFHGLINACVLPLFSAVPSVLNFDFEFKRFWEHLKSDGITRAWLTQSQLRALSRLGKSRIWSKPPGFSIALFTQGTISASLLHDFEKRFMVPIYTTYSETEAGGVVGFLTPELHGEIPSAHFSGKDVAPSGMPAPGVAVKIMDGSGQEVPVGTEGEIWVKAEQVMLGYHGTRKGDAVLDPSGFLRTGDEGYFAADIADQKLLFVTGKRSSMIQRDNVKIKPGRIDNALYNIKGVDFVMTIGFPNLHRGAEVGTYIELLRSSTLTEAEILEQLRQVIPAEECPKVIILGKRTNRTIPPTRAEVLSQFSQYFETVF